MLSLAFADPSSAHLGRANLEHMDDQTLMELLIGDRKMSSAIRERFKDADGCFRDVREWSTLDFDANGAVQKIEWSYSGMQGSLETQYMPQTTQSFMIRGNRLEGTISWQTLPEALDLFNISDNQFSGSVDFSHLPPNLGFLSIAWNHFSGSVDLSGITQSIQQFKIARNRLKGVLDLNCLPEHATVNYDEAAFEVKGYRKRSLS